MNRIVLIGALCLSLWPIGFLGWVFFVPHGSSAGGSTTSAPATTSSNPAPGTTTAAAKKSEAISIGAPKKAKKRSKKSSDESSVQIGGYICIGSAATRARKLKGSIEWLDRKLRKIKKSADAGTASQADIDYFNGNVDAFNEKVKKYNRILKQDCVKT